MFTNIIILHQDPVLQTCFCIITYQHCIKIFNWFFMPYFFAKVLKNNVPIYKFGTVFAYTALELDI